MGKAFTEDERKEVQERLRRTGLALFAEKGIKGVSIRELTKNAGIAQGGFYTFYIDKEDFLADLIELRVKEKLAGYKQISGESLDDPALFVSDIFIKEGLHLKNNKAFDNMISGTLDFFLDREGDIHGRVSGLYRDFLRDLKKLWQENGMAVEMDEEGLLNLIRAAGILFSNASLMDEEYFENIYTSFCKAEVRIFLKVTGKNG